MTVHEVAEWQLGRLANGRDLRVQPVRDSVTIQLRRFLGMVGGNPSDAEKFLVSEHPRDIPQLEFVEWLPHKHGGIHTPQRISSSRDWG